MRKYQKRIMTLATKEILLSIFDTFTPFFEASNLYKKSTRKYLSQRGMDKSVFWRKIYYWRERGLITTYIKNKERYIELTSKGKEMLRNMTLNNITIKNPKKWDGKWRIVIFDIPESSRDCRDILRAKLKQIGFLQIQKSVYVFPHKCTKEIQFIAQRLNLGNHVLISISDIIQGERIIIKKFLDRGIIKKEDIKITLQ